MKKQFTCIVCPNGCEIEAEVENGQVISVTGHTCPRGEQYVRQELTAPRRTIASSVLVKGGELPVTSVRLTKAVPKDMIFPVMDEIRKVVLTAPVKAGTIQIVVRVCILGDKDLLRTVGADLFQHLRQNGFGLFFVPSEPVIKSFCISTTIRNFIRSTSQTDVSRHIFFQYDV